MSHSNFTDFTIGKILSSNVSSSTESVSADKASSSKTTSSTDLRSPSKDDTSGNVHISPNTSSWNKKFLPEFTSSIDAISVSNVSSWSRSHWIVKPLPVKATLPPNMFYPNEKLPPQKVSSTVSTLLSNVSACSANYLLDKAPPIHTRLSAFVPYKTLPSESIAMGRVARNLENRSRFVSKKVSATITKNQGEQATSNAMGTNFMQCNQPSEEYINCINLENDATLSWNVPYSMKSVPSREYSSHNEVLLPKVLACFEECFPTTSSTTDPKVSSNLSSSTSDTTLVYNFPGSNESRWTFKVSPKHRIVPYNVSASSRHHFKDQTTPVDTTIFSSNQEYINAVNLRNDTTFSFNVPYSNEFTLPGEVSPRNEDLLLKVLDCFEASSTTGFPTTRPTVSSNFPSSSFGTTLAQNLPGSSETCWPVKASPNHTITSYNVSHSSRHHLEDKTTPVDTTKFSNSLSALPNVARNRETCGLVKSSPKQTLSSNATSWREHLLDHKGLPIHTTLSAGTERRTKNPIVNSGDCSPKMFKCSDCTFETKNKRYIYEHKKKIHNDNNNYKCKSCPYLTNCPRTFDRHVEAHYEDNEHKCPMCSFSATFLRVIMRHINSVHSNKHVPLFKC